MKRKLPFAHAGYASIESEVNPVKHKLPFAALAVLGALMLVVLSGVPSTNPAQAQNSPSVAVDLSSASVEEGTAIAVTMSFGSLTFDDDRATKDYIFRADVAGADQCEEQAGGYGLGVDRYMWKVDEDPETRRGTISGDCPAGDYTIRARISLPGGSELASASASFSVAAPEPEPTPDPDSNDDPGSNQQDPDPPAPPIVLLAIPSEFTGGEEAQISMGFSGLEFDSDRSTIDYIFRADVKDSENADADECEVQAGGYGLGVDRYMYQVDEDPETRSGTISADCPAGDYTLRASISSSGNEELAAVSANFSVAAPTADEVDDPDTALASVSSRDITLHSSNGSAVGVWSDGTTVWVSDQGDDKLYAYTLADGTRDTSKEFSTHSDNATPSGIWSNGTTIWVADAVDGKFYAYTLAGRARDSGKDFNMAGAPANVLPLGIWSNGATMWMADNRDDKLYAYTLSGGARDTGKEFSLHSDNDKPRGIWSNDTTIWVADAVDGKVYAYTLSNGARDADKDFDLGAANGDPKGIWSNGMIMWVVDEDDNKLYAYDLPVVRRGVGVGVGIGVRNSDRNRIPRITSATYKSASDTVTLTWNAGASTEGLTGFKIERSSSLGDNLVNDGETDNRPRVGPELRTYTDTGIPASWLLIYNVYALYGSTQVPSPSFQLDRDYVGPVTRSVTARLRSIPRGDGGGTRLTVTWVDDSCTDSYYVGRYVASIDEWIVLPSGGPLPITTKKYVRDYPGSDRTRPLTRIICDLDGAGQVTVMTNPTAHQLIGEDTPTVDLYPDDYVPPRSRPRSVSAYLSDRDDGNAGTKLTVNWVDDQICTTNYQVGRFVPSANSYVVISTEGFDLPRNTIVMTKDFANARESVRVRVICGGATVLNINNLQNSRLIGDVTATR